MLKKTILFLFVVISSIQVNAQKDWFKQKISDKVSVNFPIEPTKQNENSFTLKDKDGLIFVVSVVDLLKATGMSLEQFNSNVETQEFIDGFMEGLIPTMPKYTFKDTKIIKVKGFTTYQIIGRNEASKSTVYINSVFIDGIGHSLACLVADGKDTKNKDIFLNEIYINGK